MLANLKNDSSLNRRPILGDKKVVPAGGLSQPKLSIFRVAWFSWILLRPDDDAASRPDPFFMR